MGAVNLSLAKSLHGINPLNPTNWSKFPIIFGPQQMLNLVEYFLNKVFTAYHPGICKIPASVPESLGPGYFVAFFPGLGHNLWINSSLH